jgi:hypothetical protein
MTKLLCLEDEIKNAPVRRAEQETAANCGRGSCRSGKSPLANRANGALREEETMFKFIGAAVVYGFAMFGLAMFVESISHEVPVSKEE